MSSRVVRWSPEDGPAALVAGRLCAEHRGDRIDVRDPELAEALAVSGARAIRRSLLMARPVPGAPGGPDAHALAPPGIEISAMVDDPARYAGALVRAFPPEHPDFDPDIADAAAGRRALRSYFDGEVIGPWIASASAEARVTAGDAVGGIVVSRMPPHDSQPERCWITEVFVEPSYHGRGIGRALLDHALTRLGEMGEAALWLAVQVDNPARRLYERTGFTTDSSWTRFQL